MTATTAPTPVSAALAGLLARARPASSLAASQPLSAPTFPRWKGPAGHLSKTTLTALVALLAVLAALVAPGIASGLTGSTADLLSGLAAASAEAPPGLDGPAGETRVRASSAAGQTRVGVETADLATLHPGSDVLYDQTASGWLVAPRAPTGNAYSVAHEVELPSSVLGRSRSVHFNRANAALDDALQSDASFASAFDDLIPGASNSVSSAGGRATPSGWTWHHVPSSAAQGRTGVMQLVPSWQHAPGSIWQRLLHPGGFGGYAEWAVPRGAPR